MKAMSNVALIIMLLCGFAQAGEGPFVSMSFDKACVKAGKEKKLVFVDFYTTWCVPCRIMDETTFKDEKVIKWLGKHTVALKIDADKEVDLARRYRIDSYPTLVFVKPDGTEMDRIVGMSETAEFLMEAAEIISGKDPLTRAKEKLAEGDKNDPMARMEFASKLVQLGKYPEALTELLWCFDEGAKHSMAFVGVRGSFLLMELAQLGRKYPPALEAMRQRRDAALARVVEKKGSATDIFDVMDLASLNRELGAEDDTLKVYDRLRGEHPDWPAVVQLRQRVFDQLLAAHRYAEIAESVDIKQKIEQEIAQYKLGLSFLPKDRRKEMEEFERRFLVGTLAEYYQILIGLKRMDGAAEVARKTLQIDESAQTYNALAWNGYLTGSPAEANLEQARQANRLTKGQDAAILDTLARVLDALGKKGEACTLLSKAIKSFEEGRQGDIIHTCRADLGCSS